jgi:DNA-binding NtrC family response regulator
MERDCGKNEPDVPLRLAEEIGCAARSDVPVLISGAPEDGREIACAIDRHSPVPKGRVEVVDCRKDGALSRVLSHSPRGQGAPEAGQSSIVLLQEVHELSLPEQEQVDQRLDELRVSRRSEGIRIIASSSAPLFERVLEGSFLERLYYRLNVIHMVIA